MRTELTYTHREKIRTTVRKQFENGRIPNRLDTILSEETKHKISIGNKGKGRYHKIGT